MGKKTEGSAWNDAKAAKLARVPGEHIDPDLPGFGMRVSPRLKAVFTVKVSIGSGKSRKHFEETLGVVLTSKQPGNTTTGLTLAEAKKIAGAWLEEKRLPAVERETRAQRVAMCIENVLEEFLENRRIKSGLPLSSATKQYYRDVHSRYLQDCKNWSLVELQYSPREWLKIVQAANKKSTAWANGVMALISGIYDYLETLNSVDINPIRKVRKLRLVPKPPKRATHVQTLDLGKFVRQTATLRNKHSRDAVRFLLLTGLRNTAVLGMRWDAIDLERAVMQVGPDDIGWKRWTGSYPLNESAMEILRRRFAERESTTYVFPARHGGNPHMVDVRSAIAQASKGCVTLATAHILRRTFSTMTNIIFPRDIVMTGALLTHKWALPDTPEVDITLRYTVTAERMRAASNRVADTILQIGGEREMTADTLQLLHTAAIDTSSFTVKPVEGEEDEDDKVPTNISTSTHEEMAA